MATENESWTERIAAEIRMVMARDRRKQRDLADVLGMSQAAVSRRLLGQTPWDINELGKTAEFLGVPLAQLLDTPAAGAGHRGGSSAGNSRRNAAPGAPITSTSVTLPALDDQIVYSSLAAA